MSTTRVAIVHRPGLGYFERRPYDPPNPVYDAVEALCAALGLGTAPAGSGGHNPLGDLIEPGDRVIIKPNFVSSRDLHERIEGDKLRASSTHASLLRPIADYALRAAGERGRLTFVDTPVEGCELERVTEPLGVDALVRWLGQRHSGVSFQDLRSFRVVPRLALDDVRRLGRSINLGLLVREALPGDPRGYRRVDLGEQSFFAGADAADRRLCFHRSHRDTPMPHHRAGLHEYSIPQTVLDADVIINVPKMKTHKKAGVTLSLKSAVGLTNEKYWLPHFTAGDPSVGGDEFDRPQGRRDRLENLFSRLPLPGGHSLIARAPRADQRQGVIDGSWEGNDTLWRTILDLNRILFFADREGRISAQPQRRYLTIVDGIVGGEGEGPLGAEPVHAGVLVGGFDPAVVDHFAAELMGLDPTRIPQIARAIEARLLPGTDLDAAERILDGDEPRLAFRPPRSWPSLRRR